MTLICVVLKITENCASSSGCPCRCAGKLRLSPGFPSNCAPFSASIRNVVWVFGKLFLVRSDRSGSRVSHVGSIKVCQERVHESIYTDTLYVLYSVHFSGNVFVMVLCVHILYVSSVSRFAFLMKVFIIRYKPRRVNCAFIKHSKEYRS